MRRLTRMRSRRSSARPSLSILLPERGPRNASEHSREFSPAALGNRGQFSLFGGVSKLSGHCRDPFLDGARVMHRAELRPAHPAELRALEVLGRKCLVVIFLRAVGIERETELFLPVKRVARA